MRIRIIWTIASFATLLLTTTGPGEAAGTQVRARFAFDALATCTQPPVQAFPVHAEGTAMLSVDRTATLEMDSSIQGRETYTAKLGAKPTEALGGSASLRVLGKHTLRAVREYPNNLIIATMTLVGKSCRLRIDHRLKPGKRQYTFTGSAGVAVCSKPRMTHTECTAF
jgi:hypothetical protein